MKYINSKIMDFLNEIDSSSPTPGGGSVSALAISQGISLVRMVSHLTITKKKFHTLDEITKSDYLNRMQQLDEIKNKVSFLVDKDPDAYNEVMEAYKLPKSNDEEIMIRQNSINKGTIQATQVPFDTASFALQALQISQPMLQYANKNATSDFGVGILMINAGMIGAILNVRTNMNNFINTNIAENYLNSVRLIELEGTKIVNDLMGNVNILLKK